MSIGIILMSKAPIPGYTKTRLQPDLTAKQSALLHQAFLLDMGKMLLKLKSLSCRNINLYLSYTPGSHREMFNKLIPAEFERFPQSGDELGEKMYNSLLYSYNKDDKYQIIMGSDLPSLQIDTIMDAVHCLDNNKDLVLGPSCDGGYYLLAGKRPYPWIFENIDWGKGEVFQQTINVIKKHNCSYDLIKKTGDIDNFAELLDFYRQLQLKNYFDQYPHHTACLLDRLLAERS